MTSMTCESCLHVMVECGWCQGEFCAECLTPCPQCELDICCVCAKEDHDHAEIEVHQESAPGELVIVKLEEGGS